MLLKRIRVTNSRGSRLDLPLEDISDGFVVKEIGGLGPVKATLVSSSFANQDGEQYHSSRREPRNITIKLGLDPDYATESVHDLRAKLYDFFMPKTQAKLEFNLFDKFSDNIIEQTIDLQIDARIESCEPDVFTRDPALNLSLMCFDPDFVNPDPVVVEDTTVDDLTETTIEYSGSVDTGAIFTLFPDRSLSEFTIYHRTPEDKLRTVDFEYDLLSGDELKISSIRGSKYVTLTRDGVEIPVLFAVSQQSSWLEFSPGGNNLRVHAEGDPIPFSIEYTRKYGGL